MLVIKETNEYVTNYEPESNLESISKHNFEMSLVFVTKSIFAS